MTAFSEYSNHVLSVSLWIQITAIPNRLFLVTGSTNPPGNFTDIHPQVFSNRV